MAFFVRKIVLGADGMGVNVASVAVQKSASFSPRVRNADF
jgi:hypothetical protein